MSKSDIVDLRGIATLLGVSKHTPNQWRQRDLLPPVDFPELLRPVWKKSTIIQWARDTGRWPPGEAARPESRSSPVKESSTRQEAGFRTVQDRAADIPPAIFLTPGNPAAA